MLLKMLNGMPGFRPLSIASPIRWTVPFTASETSATADFGSRAGCNLLKTEGSDTSRRQFDRERDAAELATDVADDRCIRIRQNDGAAACRRALHEELDRRKVKHLGGGKAGVGRRALERGKAVNVFALDTQYFPAGDQDMKLRQLGK